MTRRKFLDGVLKIGSAVALFGLGSVKWLADKVSPTRFVNAVRMGRYPGKIKSLESIDQQGKWSG